MARPTIIVRPNFKVHSNRPNVYDKLLDRPINARNSLSTRWSYGTGPEGPRPFPHLIQTEPHPIPSQTATTPRAPRTPHPSDACYALCSRHGRRGAQARPRRRPPRAVVVPGHARRRAPARACAHRGVIVILLLLVARGGQLQARARRGVGGAPRVARGDGRVREGVRRHHLREGRQ